MATEDLMTVLRGATLSAHHDLEHLPYFQSLDRGDLALPSFVGHLRGLAVLHGALERELTRARDPRLQRVWTADLGRFHLLQADLDYFEPWGAADTPAAQDAIRALTHHMLAWCRVAPLSLLGHLYVLEGSIGGAQVLAPRLAQSFDLDPQHGLAYFSWQPEAARARWQAFKERMNALALTGAESETVVQAATGTFAGIGRLLAALHPLPGGMETRAAASINPEAGAHPVAQDRQELEAARRAGQRCWSEFPYLPWRFGERGWRFTQSDSAWLVTLAALEPPELHSRVGWLTGILACRGMPSLLLQRHLERLYEELRGRLPERPGRSYEKLLIAADHLADQRRRFFNDQTFEGLTQGFDRAVGLDWCARLPQTGALLVSAVADGALGITEGVANVETWMTDPERFPPHWIAAVLETLRTAEQHAGTRIRV